MGFLDFGQSIPGTNGIERMIECPQMLVIAAGEMQSQFADVCVRFAPACSSPDPRIVGNAAEQRARALAQSTELAQERNRRSNRIEIGPFWRDLVRRKFVQIRIVLHGTQVHFRENPMLLIPHGDEDFLRGWFATVKRSLELVLVVNRRQPSRKMVDREVQSHNQRIIVQPFDCRELFGWNRRIDID